MNLSQAHEKKKWEYPNKTKIRNKRWNKSQYNRYRKNHKSILQLSANKLDSLENEQISRIIQPSKTESERNNLNREITSNEIHL